jgi:hypothetical protein
LKRLNLSPPLRTVALDAELTVEVRRLTLATLGELLPHEAGPVVVPDDASPAEKLAPLRPATDFAVRVIEALVVGWNVVCSETDAPQPVSGRVARLMLEAEPALVQAVYQEVWQRAIIECVRLAEEGNASAPSPNGSTAPALNTAPTATDPAPTAPRARPARKRGKAS